MSEIAKCPVCNGTNIRQEYEIGDCNPETYVSYECWDCGDVAPTFRTKETWNQYAAAMELAKAKHKRMTTNRNIFGDWDDNDESLHRAEMRVLEVFK